MLVGDVFSWVRKLVLEPGELSKLYINRNTILFVVSTGKSGLYLEIITASQRLQFMV